jgi:hypothetical protein
MAGAEVAMPPRGRQLSAPIALLLALAACVSGPSATPSATTTVPSPTLLPSASPSTQASSQASASGRPTPTPEPPLSLDRPRRRDDRHIRVGVQPDISATGSGHLVITVTNLSDRRVHELVLRWSSELNDQIFLAPFEPSQARIAEFGPPLLQDWTKWVLGPGELGEPAGTTSVGWGPLDPSATLTIPLVATRRVPGAVGFDLQLLAGEAILSLPSGQPAELRVSVR